MIKELIMLITLLGAPEYKTREKAQMTLECSKVTFSQLVHFYPQKDPEINHRLKEVLFQKYLEDKRDVYTKTVYLYNDDNEYVGSETQTDMRLLKYNFEWDVRHK